MHIAISNQALYFWISIVCTREKHHSWCLFVTHLTVSDFILQVSNFQNKIGNNQSIFKSFSSYIYIRKYLMWVSASYSLLKTKCFFSDNRFYSSNKSSATFLFLNKSNIYHHKNVYFMNKTYHTYERIILFHILTFICFIFIMICINFNCFTNIFIAWTLFPMHTHISFNDGQQVFPPLDKSNNALH